MQLFNIEKYFLSFGCNFLSTMGCNFRRTLNITPAMIGDGFAVGSGLDWREAGEEALHGLMALDRPTRTKAWGCLI